MKEYILTWTKGPYATSGIFLDHSKRSLRKEYELSHTRDPYVIYIVEFSLNL